MKKVMLLLITFIVLLLIAPMRDVVDSSPSSPAIKAEKELNDELARDWKKFSTKENRLSEAK